MIYLSVEVFKTIFFIPGVFMKNLRTLGLLALLMVVPSVFAAPEVPGKGVDRTLKATAGALVGAATSYTRHEVSKAIMNDLEQYLIQKFGEGKWRSRFATLTFIAAQITHLVSYEVAREYVAGLIDGNDEEQIATKTSRVSAFLSALYLNRTNLTERLVIKTRLSQKAEKAASVDQAELDLGIALSNSITPAPAATAPVATN